MVDLPILCGRPVVTVAGSYRLDASVPTEMQQYTPTDAWGVLYGPVVGEAGLAGGREGEAGGLGG